MKEYKIWAFARSAAPNLPACEAVADKAFQTAVDEFGV